MKPVLVPLLPADMASAKVYSERLCGNAKWLCPEGLLCTDSVFRIVSCAGRVHSIPILFAVSVLILVWIGGFGLKEKEMKGKLCFVAAALVACILTAPFAAPRAAAENSVLPDFSDNFDSYEADGKFIEENEEFAKNCPIRRFRTLFYLFL